MPSSQEVPLTVACSLQPLQLLLGIRQGALSLEVGCSPPHTKELSNRRPQPPWKFLAHRINIMHWESVHYSAEESMACIHA